MLAKPSLIKCRLSFFLLLTINHLDRKAAKDSFFSFQQYKCNSSEISEQNPYFYYQSHSPCYDLFVEAEPITPSMQTFFFYGQLIGTLFFNVVIETSFAEVATYLRKSSLSRELRSASTKIFISQFLNTAVLPLLAKSTAVMTFIRSIPLFAPREEIYQTMCEKQVIMESADDATFLGIKWYINYGSNMVRPPSLPPVLTTLQSSLS